MEEVIWKQALGYDGYWVSSAGQILSVKIKGSKVRRVPFEKGIIIGSTRKDGYRYIYPEIDGRKYTVSIHHLVLEAFVGPCPPGMECRHLDGNPSNNQLKNLCWGTHAENVQDTLRHGTFSYVRARGEGNGRSRLTTEQVINIRTRYNQSNATMSSMAREYGVSCTTIQNIIHRRRWKHVGQP